MKRPRSKPKNLLTQQVVFTPNYLELILPIRTVSEANNFDHWTKKHRRHKMQKGAVVFALSPYRSFVRLPCNIVLTRYAPRTFDKRDNLPISFKYITDAICEELTGCKVAGRADNDERIEITFAQMKSKLYGIKIEIRF